MPPLTNTEYRICTKTVMDTSDPDINFDENGISNYWWEYHKSAETELKHGEEGLAFAQKLANKIKQENRNKPYDCLIGASGGVDSSYVAYWVHKLGLRALAVHLDNGWNNELAIANIEALVERFDLDLHTEVLDWPEFRDLQRSFFLASVPNSETPTDHAIVATLFRLAAKHGIRYIISGANLVTEGVNQKNAGHRPHRGCSISLPPAPRLRLAARARPRLPHYLLRWWYSHAVALSWLWGHATGQLAFPPGTTA